MTGEHASHPIENTPHVDPLFVDTYVGDGRSTAANVLTLMNAGPPWHGLIHKLTQGTYHSEGRTIRWFRDAMRCHNRFGVDFWEGYYHYLDLSEDPKEQAEHFWDEMRAIGGENAGTLWAMVDVERGGQRAVPPAQRVLASVAVWSGRYEQLSGRKPTLYGGELLRSIGIHRPGAPANLLGCGRSAIASYTARLTVDVIAATGTDPDHLLFWQYCGDGVEQLAGYPREAPGFGAIDISAMVLPGGLPALRSALAEPRAVQQTTA